ncbi:hypothetical protein RFI_12623 [Reticulomyxa filosa]|uniref:Uncharacterized protein n=1 Tax=Reticulomyxa filosa TaxID=46433 RepID=X6NEW5_RETFI|nr:hypothetical protein RFI_12623 [Reticulomyxa filosa]|eukprot:ETO24536.1 hypothetical protein RFI_12623 [Reticulomyxa filosa]
MNSTFLFVYVCCIHLPLLSSIFCVLNCYHLSVSQKKKKRGGGNVLPAHPYLYSLKKKKKSIPQERKIQFDVSFCAMLLFVFPTQKVAKKKKKANYKWNVRFLCTYPCSKTIGGGRSLFSTVDAVAFRWTKSNVSFLFIYYCYFYNNNHKKTINKKKKKKNVQLVGFDFFKRNVTVWICSL